MSCSAPTLTVLFGNPQIPHHNCSHTPSAPLTGWNALLSRMCRTAPSDLLVCPHRSIGLPSQNCWADIDVLRYLHGCDVLPSRMCWVFLNDMLGYP